MLHNHSSQDQHFGPNPPKQILLGIDLGVVHVVLMYSYISLLCNSTVLFSGHAPKLVFSEKCFLPGAEDSGISPSDKYLAQ